MHQIYDKHARVTRGHRHQDHVDGGTEYGTGEHDDGARVAHHTRDAQDLQWPTD